MSFAEIESYLINNRKGESLDIALDFLDVVKYNIYLSNGHFPKSSDFVPDYLIEAFIKHGVL